MKERLKEEYKDKLQKMRLSIVKSTETLYKIRDYLREAITLPDEIVNIAENQVRIELSAMIDNLTFDYRTILECVLSLGIVPESIKIENRYNIGELENPNSEITLECIIDRLSKLEIDVIESASLLKLHEERLNDSERKVENLFRIIYKKLHTHWWKRRSRDEKEIKKGICRG